MFSWYMYTGIFVLTLLMSGLDETSELLQVSDLGGNLLEPQAHGFVCRSNVDRSDHQTSDLDLRQAADLLLQA